METDGIFRLQKRTMIYKNKKNKKPYTVLNMDVINCTNEVDGQRMVLYTIDGRQFVREYGEFMEKFEKS